MDIRWEKNTGPLVDQMSRRDAVGAAPKGWRSRFQWLNPTAEQPHPPSMRTQPVRLEETPGQDSQLMLLGILFLLRGKPSKYIYLSPWLKEQNNSNTKSQWGCRETESNTLLLGCKMVQLSWKSVWTVLDKWNRHLSRDSATALLSICTREMEMCVHTETYMQDSHGSPVLTNSHFHCQGPGFNPRSGN